MKISVSELRSRLSQIKLLALDVDGVLTEGGLYYTDTGEELKKFNVKDGQGLKLIMQAGIDVAIITASSSSSVIHRAKKLGINQVFIGAENKLSVLENICQQLNISLTQVAYMGDDVNDIPILKAVGCPLSVADAMPKTKTLAISITQLSGGQGVVREICDYFLNLKSTN
ncbi:MAG: KdsC family phosphatase [Xenococcus sp. (in: cyanobacteria)]